MKNYKLDKHVFSTTEITTILTGLSSLPHLIKHEELINTIIKMKSFIPDSKRDEINFKTEQIHVDLSQWIGHRNLQPYLETIKLALLEGKLLSFDYIDTHGNKTERKVEPYQIILKGSHWYFHSYCHSRHDFRLFKLSRISNLKVTHSTFKPRKYKKPVLEFPDLLTSIQTIIKLRVRHSILDRILDFCSYEDCLPDGDDYFIVNFPFIDNDYYYTILLSFGSQCECLEPLQVRDTLKRKVDEIASLYKN